MAAIFVNYRNEDAAWAVVLDGELSRRFGADMVFRAPRSITPGQDFEVRLREAVRHSSVLIAIIGRRWLLPDEQGLRRIDAAGDWVRTEIALAFSTGVPVIPVLVDDVGRLSPDALPHDICQLGRCQYLRLHHRNSARDLARIGDELSAMVPRLSRRDRRSDAPTLVEALPRDVHGFAGRRRELDTVRALAGRHGVVTIAGKPGVGKSALAIHLAHLIADRYPDGQLYIDLRGMRPDPLLPAAVRRAVTRALDSGPGDDDNVELRYQELLRRRRLIVVLDDAADEDQVRTLLPNGGDSVVLVTSRRPLADLAEAPPAVTLDTMPPDDAYALFAGLAGEQRLDAEPGATAEILRHCGGLPLALRIVGGRLRSRPRWRVSELARRLADEKRRLDELRLGDLEVRASINLSYLELLPATADVLRRLSAAPGSDFGLEVAGAAAELSIGDVEIALDELVDAQLMDARTAVRFHFHDLIRLFAAELLPESERLDVIRRVTGVYAAQIKMAAAALGRQGPVARLELAYENDVSPTRWLGLERQNLRAAINSATDPSDVWEIANALLPCLEQTSAHYGELLELVDIAERAATALGDEVLMMRAECHRGRVLRRVGRLRDSVAVLGRSAVYFVGAGQFESAADAYFWLSLAARELGSLDEAALALAEAFTLHVRTERYLDAAGMLIEVAIILKERRRLDEAAELLRFVLGYLRPAMRTTGDQRRVAWGHENLGAVLKELGQIAEAVEQHETSLRLFRTLDLTYGEACATRNLGHCALLSGQHARAVDLFSDSLALYRKIGERSGADQALASTFVALLRARRPVAMVRMAIVNLGTVRRVLASANVRAVFRRTLRPGGETVDLPLEEALPERLMRVLRDAPGQLIDRQPLRGLE
ncbi:toll/interleukin-1 receptor domain-containing protein [Herbidospora sp. NBRC 101105]|uniref:ATP-binding protein n=1 Tax=Herbidospora sp. NBRC 101105 TaxID=3032195 RepID=UPI0024A5B68B|nr:toll/interleukin-1 receptor domain-containing protein [Herbidospora sp. NBRC 101105]GLX93085.1 hypothetical protein Hesp01_10350 [Herbidospora sp. NBRC 101105]